jgi:hypothetical protein
LAISFNLDPNVDVAESFFRKNAYTFPALDAKQCAEDLMADLAIPRTWIKDGVIVSERLGFGGDGDKGWKRSWRRRSSRCSGEWITMGKLVSLQAGA